MKTLVGTPDDNENDRPDHSVNDNQELVVGPVSFDPTGHVAPDTHAWRAGGAVPAPAAEPMSDADTRTEPPTRPLVHDTEADDLLRLLSESLDDMERVRIATENRARSLRQAADLPDGVGFPEVDRLDALAKGLAALEHSAELDIKRALRNHPLGAWVKGTVGVGEKQGARLIAAIGDPYWRPDLCRDGFVVRPAGPRTVSELWAYCGYHVVPAPSACAAQMLTGGDDPSRHPDHEQTYPHPPCVGVAPSRKRGAKANWNSQAKMRAFLVAESCIKQAHSPYRAVYDAGRAKYAAAVHQTPCPRCGPSGKPALVGSPLSAGHQHARAMRLVAKAILRDLWIAARSHELTDHQRPHAADGDTSEEAA